MEVFKQLDEFVASYSAKNGLLTATNSCRRFWESVPQQQRVALLLEILSRYRTCRQEHPKLDEDRLRESFALNELTVACYELGITPSEEESLRILRTAFHTCGHGRDVAPPLDLALRHFEEKPYSPELFDALRTYRATLRRSRGVLAQNLKGKIDLILWQDWNDPVPSASCWTAHIRDNLRAMDSSEQALWNAVLQTFVHCTQVEPTKKWFARIQRPLTRLTGQAFGAAMQEWLGPSAPVSRPQLTTAGGHILKNLIWCAVLVNDPALDRSLMCLLDIRGHEPPAYRIAGALAYLWSRREPAESVQHLARIASSCSYPGEKIEQHYRRATQLSGKVE